MPDLADSDYDLVPVDQQPQFVDSDTAAWNASVDPNTGRPHISVAPPPDALAPQGALAQQVSGFPQRAADLGMAALGPIGEAGMTVGDMLRTGQVDPRDIPQVVGGVMMGVAAPEAEEAAPLEAGAEAVAKGLGALPMDDASRMARATAQGYTTPAFHGTKASEFSKFDPSFIKDNVQYGGNFYFSGDPSFVSQRVLPYGGDEGRMMPVMLKIQKPFQMDQPITGNEASSVLNAMGQPDRAKLFKPEGDNPIKNWTKSTMFYFGMGQNVSSAEKAEAIRKAGFDAIIGDPAKEITGTPGKHHIMVYDPDQIRSRFAAFHPESVGTGDIMGMPPSAKGITAYHGSPYDFDKFDLSKIGTGEGAQAYGHGLYFAENPGTAQSYKESTIGRSLNIAGKEVPYDDAFEHLSSQVAQENPGFSAPGQAANWVLNKIAKGQNPAQVRYAISNMAWTPEQRAAANSALDTAHDWSPQPGKMYQVSINADPEHFLDWDKPLSAQSDPVRQKLVSAGFTGAADDSEFAAGLKRMSQWMKTKDYNQSWRDSGDFRRDMGRMLDVWDSGGDQAGIEWLKSNPQSLVTYKALPNRSASFVDEVAKNPDNVDKLRQAGIPGIKYLDQGSRNADQFRVQSERLPGGAEGGVHDVIGPGNISYGRFSGYEHGASAYDKARALAEQKNSEGRTSNYVVFDDNLINIVKKYGMAGLIAGGGAHFATVPTNNKPDFGDQRFAKGGSVKSTKAQAHYHGGTKAKRCADCNMFEPPHGCSAVRGSISPHGVCDFFERKAASKAA